MKDSSTLERGEFVAWLRTLPEGETTRVPERFTAVYGASCIGGVIAQRTRGQRDRGWLWRVDRYKDGWPRITKVHRHGGTP